MSKQAAPQYRVVFSEVARAVVTAAAYDALRLQGTSAELPLLVGGGLPVFSREWGAGKPFDEVIMETPIAQRPVQDRPRELRPRHHLQPRPGLLGARSERAPRHVQLRPHHVSRSTRTTPHRRRRSRPASSTTSRCSRRRDWARVYTGKKFDSGELIKDRAGVAECRRFPGLPHQHAARQIQGSARARGARPRLRFRMDEPPADVTTRYDTRARLFQQQRFRGEGVARPGRARASRTAARQASAEGLHREVPLPPSTNPPEQLARQPEEGAGNCSPGRLDLSRRRVAQREGRGLHASNTWTATVASVTTTPYFQALRQLGHRGQLSARGFRADPEAARRLRFRSVHGAHPRQRVSGQRAARPLRLGVRRYRGLEQSDRHARSGGRRAGEPRRCRRRPGRSSSRACVRSTACCGAATTSSRSIFEHVSASHIAPASSSSPAWHRCYYQAGGLGHFHVVAEEQ